MQQQLEIVVQGSTYFDGGEALPPVIILNGHRFVLDARMGPGFDESIRRDIQEIIEIIREHHR